MTYSCPDCGGPVAPEKDPNGPTPMFGLVGKLLVTALTDTYTCANCGPFSRSKFPAATRVRMYLGAVGLACVAAALAAPFIVNLLLPPGAIRDWLEPPPLVPQIVFPSEFRLVEGDWKTGGLSAVSQDGAAQMTVWGFVGPVFHSQKNAPHEDAWHVAQRAGLDGFRAKFVGLGDEVQDVTRLKVGDSPAVLVEHVRTGGAGEATQYLRSHLILFRNRWFVVTLATLEAYPDKHIDEMQRSLETFELVVDPQTEGSIPGDPGRPL